MKRSSKVDETPETVSLPADREGKRLRVARGVVDSPNGSIYIYQDGSAMSNVVGTAWNGLIVEVLTIDAGFALIRTTNATGWIPSYFLRGA